jgi:transcription antitermination factor NusG
VQNSSQWLVLQLNEDHPAEYREIESAIQTAFGSKADYFIPVSNEKMGSYLTTSVLIDGYAFIKDSNAVRCNIENLLDQKIFTGVLSNCGKYQTVDAKVIRELKKKLKNSFKKQYEIGERVKVLDGVLKNLIGEVVGEEDDGKKVIIRVTRISREIIAPVPATLLEKIR